MSNSNYCSFCGIHVRCGELTYSEPFYYCKACFDKKIKSVRKAIKNNVVNRS